MPESGRPEDKRRDSNELPPSSDPDPLSVRRLVEDHEKEEETIEIEAVSIGGYTFGVRYQLRKDDSNAGGEVRALFDVHLTSGDWDNKVPWPFGQEGHAGPSAHRESGERRHSCPCARAASARSSRNPNPGRCNQGPPERTSVLDGD
ncbi:hypothetical protein MTO96_051976 [Rhipicephalus appendiculatus]